MEGDCGMVPKGVSADPWSALIKGLKASGLSWTAREVAIAKKGRDMEGVATATCPTWARCMELEKRLEELDKRRERIPLGRKAWTQTWSGVAVDLDDPDPRTILVQDMAHQLARINRFNGATRFPYSVAQHSVLCALAAPAGFSLEALMHDGHEYVFGDLASPVKALIGPACKAAEERIQKAVAWKWRLPFPTSEEVKETDVRMLWTEHLALQSKEPRPWLCQDAESLNVEIAQWSPETAEEAFLSMYETLGGPGRMQP
jgi:hypothetical protein